MADDIEVDYPHLRDFSKHMDTAVDSWSATGSATIGPMAGCVAGLPMVLGGGVQELMTSLTDGNGRWLDVHGNTLKQLGVLGLDMLAVEMEYRKVDTEANLATANSEVLKANEGIDNETIRKWNTETAAWNRETTAENGRLAGQEGVTEANRDTARRNETIVASNETIVADNKGIEEDNAETNEENRRIVGE
jgi:hypothetical protein